VKIHHQSLSFPRPNQPVVTTGTFDGVHLGHKTILNRLIESARQIQGESVVITFDPHPRQVLYPNDHSLKLLQSVDEKAARLEALGVDHLLVIKFDKVFSELSSDEFIRTVLVDAIGTKKLVVGYDHHFGKNREGSFESLRKQGLIHGFSVEEIPAHDIDQVAVSSTAIRKALTLGEIKTANSYLGYPYSFSGEVVQGNQMGRQMGFPTANLKISHALKLIPASGVYAVTVEIQNRTYQGMLNIGYRPTITDDKILTCEVHVLDFSSDIYGETIRVQFIDRLRDEIRFSGKDELIQQLNSDKIHAAQLLNSI
jgi:riboflavin kinase / FMN adenylyltransferase